MAIENTTYKRGELKMKKQNERNLIDWWNRKMNKSELVVKTIKKDLRIGKFLSRETTGYQPNYDIGRKD